MPRPEDGHGTEAGRDGWDIRPGPHHRPAGRPRPARAHLERLRGWLHAHGIGEWDVETVLIATGEACANAIEHGYRFAPDGITTLRVELRDDRLEIEVRDHGAWRPADGGDESDRGRGRLIMARVMDEATIVGTPEGTCVRLVKRLSPAG